LFSAVFFGITDVYLIYNPSILSLEYPPRDQSVRIVAALLSELIDLCLGEKLHGFDALQSLRSFSVTASIEVFFPRVKGDYRG
jgi:hypothetical protein